jgi:hypothetical protein
MPLIRRVPKRGFHNLFRKEFAIVNLARLEKFDGDEVTPQSLLAAGVISSLRDGLKILGDGEVKRPLKVTAHRVSKAARQKIEAAGGNVELLAVLERARRKTAPQAPASEAPAPKPAKAKVEKAKPAAKAKAAKPAAAEEAKPSKGKAAKGKTSGETTKK